MINRRTFLKAMGLVVVAPILAIKAIGRGTTNITCDTFLMKGRKLRFNSKDCGIITLDTAVPDGEGNYFGRGSRVNEG